MDKRYFIILCIVVLLILPIVMVWQGTIEVLMTAETINIILLLFCGIFIVGVFGALFSTQTKSYKRRKGGVRNDRQSYWPNDDSLIGRIKRGLGLAATGGRDLVAPRTISDIRRSEDKSIRKRREEHRKDVLNERTTSRDRMGASYYGRKRSLVDRFKEAIGFAVEEEMNTVSNISRFRREEREDSRKRGRRLRDEVKKEKRHTLKKEKAKRKYRK